MNRICIVSLYNLETYLFFLIYMWNLEIKMLDSKGKCLELSVRKKNLTIVEDVKKKGTCCRTCNSIYSQVWPEGHRKICLWVTSSNLFSILGKRKTQKTFFVLDKATRTGITAGSEMPGS